MLPIPLKICIRGKRAGNIMLKMNKKRTICIQPGSSCSSLLITFPISSVQLYPTIIPIHFQNSQPYDWKCLSIDREKEIAREGGRKRWLQMGWVGYRTLSLSVSLSVSLVSLSLSTAHCTKHRKERVKSFCPPKTTAYVFMSVYEGERFNVGAYVSVHVREWADGGVVQSVGDG